MNFHPRYNLIGLGIAGGICGLLTLLWQAHEDAREVWSQTLLVLGAVSSTLFVVGLIALIWDRVEDARVRAEVASFKAKGTRPLTPAQEIDSGIAYAAVGVLAEVLIASGDSMEGRKACAWQAAKVAGKWLSQHQIDDRIYLARQPQRGKLEEDIDFLAEFDDDEGRRDTLRAAIEIQIGGSLDASPLGVLRKLAAAWEIADSELTALFQQAQREAAAKSASEDPAQDDAARESMGSNQDRQSYSYADEDEDVVYQISDGEGPPPSRISWSPEQRRALRVLGLRQDADIKSARSRYLSIVMRNHPDRIHQEEREERHRAELRFKEAVEAWEILRSGTA